MRAAKSVAQQGTHTAASPPGFYAAIGQLLGLAGEVHSEVDLARRVERGIPARSVDQLRMHLGLDDEEVYRLIAPRRTLARRLASKESLTPQESDQAVRVARVSVLARRVFAGNPDYAAVWLREPKRSLAGRTPLAVLTTGPGARAVEEMLIGIEHGLFA